jgi:spore maturation protein SpmA
VPWCVGRWCGRTGHRSGRRDDPFLGLMKVVEAGGMLVILARLIRPLMVRLFPEVPADHPAMGAMILNMSANALGLGNAATPFGIRAMQELDRLNAHKGTATNAMALFLAVNTSSVTLLPTGVIALRAAAGSSDPGHYPADHALCHHRVDDGCHPGCQMLPAGGPGDPSGATRRR